MKSLQQFITEQKDKKYSRGDSVHNPAVNRTGMILKVSGDTYTVRTTKGKEEWKHSEVEFVEDL